MKKKTATKVAREKHSEPDFSGGVRGKYARGLKENGYTIRVYRQDGSFSEKRVLGENIVRPNLTFELISRIQRR